MSRVQANGVLIREYGGDWQASVPVLNPEMVKTPGLKGTCSDSGPWIGGNGCTPEEALHELYVAIGKLMLPVLLAAPSERSEP